jgi:hypothetical protein
MTPRLILPSIKVNMIEGGAISPKVFAKTFQGTEMTLYVEQFWNFIRSSKIDSYKVNHQNS